MSTLADRRGALFMALAMAGFAVEDLLLKIAARQMPVGQILILFGLGGTAAFAALARAAGQSAIAPATFSNAMLWRTIFEMAGRVFYTLAFALTPLTSASAILQAAPLVVTAGAAVFFGERVGWRRWLAVAAGFAGVLVILRPGLHGFSALSLLAVAGMLGFALRDLATRAAPPALSTWQLGVAGFAAMVPAGAVLLGWSGGASLPDTAGLAALAGAVAIGVAAYAALTVAMRTGAVGAVAPFRYTRLVFAFLLAALFLGERPDAATWIGSAIVVGSGLYALSRANRTARIAG